MRRLRGGYAAVTWRLLLADTWQVLPREMRRRLREYFHQSLHLMHTRTSDKLMARMSPMLQAEVALRCHERFLRNVWYFRDVEHEFIVQVRTRSVRARNVQVRSVPVRNVPVRNVRNVRARHVSSRRGARNVT